MQIESLKIYCDVARRRSFSRGAEANQITQSSASQTIHQLERHLGVTLIERASRPLRLTTEGQRYYDGCQEVLQRYQDIENTVRHLHEQGNTLVRMAAIYSVGLGDISQYIQKFATLEPRARVQVEYLHPDQVYERVIAEAVDFGVVSFPQPRRDLAITSWRREPMVLVCPPGHRLAGEKTVKVASLKGEPLIAFDEALMIRRRTDRFLKRHGVVATVAFEFDNIEAIKRAVEVGSGLAILPRPTLEREVALGTLVAVPLADGDFVRPLGILQRRGRRQYPNTTRFLDLLCGRLPGSSNGTTENPSHEQT